MSYKEQHALRIEELLTLLFEANPQHNMSAIEAANRLTPVPLIEKVLHQMHLKGLLSTTVEPMKRSYRQAPPLMKQEELEASLIYYLEERSQPVILNTLCDSLKAKGSKNKEMLELILAKLVNSGAVSTKEKKKGIAYILTSKLEAGQNGN